MPELPDVELYKRYLDQHALRRTIERVAVNDARILGELPAQAFIGRLTGNRFENSRRHGKHLLVRLRRDGWLTLHFGMTGNVVYFRNEADDPPYDRVRFDFAGGAHLAYVNRRMLGRVGLAEDADAFVRDEGLGPDALDPAFDLAAFEGAIEGRRRDVKSVLMDQALIAGVGNIYADEILFQARLHPHMPVTSLDGRQRAELFRQVKQVLEKAIACGAGAEQSLERLPDDYLLPHRDKQGRCPPLRRSDRDPEGGWAGQLLLSTLPARPGLIRPGESRHPAAPPEGPAGPCAPLRVLPAWRPKVQ